MDRVHFMGYSLHVSLRPSCPQDSLRHVQTFRIPPAKPLQALLLSLLTHLVRSIAG
jgi:hypothetical protein